jgi:hypothetical protein
VQHNPSVSRLSGTPCVLARQAWTLPT